MKCMGQCQTFNFVSVFLDTNVCVCVCVYVRLCLYYYTPLPVYVASKQATCHDTSLFWLANVFIPSVWALPYSCNLFH